MTDKQIIIDAVDVSGCDFYDKNKKYCLTLKMDTTGFKNPSCFSGDFQKCIQDSKVCPNTFCDNNPNCYYKQLKRKEQEYEELRQYHNKCCEENAKKETELLEKYNQVSRDFYNGKYCNKEICNLLKAKEQECERTKERLESFQKDYSKLYKVVENKGYINELDKLKETLTEIKEIAEFYNNSNMDNICYQDGIYEILQKINEVENEHNG